MKITSETRCWWICSSSKALVLAKMLQSSNVKNGMGSAKGWKFNPHCSLAQHFFHLERAKPPGGQLSTMLVPCCWCAKVIVVDQYLIPLHQGCDTVLSLLVGITSIIRRPVHNPPPLRPLPVVSSTNLHPPKIDMDSVAIRLEQTRDDVHNSRKTESRMSKLAPYCYTQIHRLAVALSSLRDGD